MGKTEVTQEEYQAVMGSNPSKYAGDLNRPVEQVNWQEAMALWEDALELAPDDAEILNNYAVALEAIGSYEEAGRIYEKALTIKPDSRRIRRNLMLNKDFYVSYVLREDPKESDGPTDGDGQTPPPGDPQGEESPPPEKEQNKDGEGGGDDDQI